MQWRDEQTRTHRPNSTLPFVFVGPASLERFFVFAFASVFAFVLFCSTFFLMAGGKIRIIFQYR